MSSFVVLVPSRGRPKNLRGLLNAWEATDAAARIHVGLDEDDPELAAYREIRHPKLTMSVGPRQHLVGTLNDIATRELSHAEFIGFMGDDHRPRTPGWDLRFIEVLEANAPAFVYGDDLLQHEKIPTAIGMSAEVVSTLGYMAPPELVHLNIDIVWLAWAQALDRLTYLPDVVIEHLHPANGKAPNDETYREANSAERVRDDGATFARYRDGGGMDADVEKLRTLIGG